jgi:oligosaccharide reducing-end xylanase
MIMIKVNVPYVNKELKNKYIIQEEKMMIKPLKREYENFFARIGLTDEDVHQKIWATYESIFFDDQEKFYHEIGEDKGFLRDTGNNDARTEGMSYGMMMAVQLDQQDVFDKLWLFSHTFMQQHDGDNEGYFAWSVSPEGKKFSEGPAPDGEEYFALALFFASSRWGNRQAPFDYSHQARKILRHCLHQDELVEGGHTMWDLTNYYIKFVPSVDFSDPSYHLPHFYEIFAERADEQDRDFWAKVAQASRDYIRKSCHPSTGMSAEYAEYDGRPKHIHGKDFDFYSDAYRVAMNIGLDTLWFGEQEGYQSIIESLQNFLDPQEGINHTYMLDGTKVDEPAMHPDALLVTTAAGSTAAKHKELEKWLKAFWERPLRKGERRYYDNCLYLFSLMILAGVYKIY